MNMRPYLSRSFEDFLNPSIKQDKNYTNVKLTSE